jgi:transposase
MSQITIFNGPERRRRWSDDDRLQILEAAFAPGANVSDVARRFDVSTSLIYQWRTSMLKKNAAPDFVPAVVVEEAPDTLAPVRDPVITIQFSHGATVLIEAAAPTVLVTAALRALR